MGSDAVEKARNRWDPDDGTASFRVVLSRVGTLVALALGGFVAALALIGLPILGTYLFIAGLLLGVGFTVSFGRLGRALKSWRGRSRRALGES
jgi:hypothetical protein